MNQENLTQLEALGLMFELIGSWNHYYCSKCKRNHLIDKSSLLPKPSKIFINHIEFSKNPYKRKKTWVGKKVLEPKLPQLKLYQMVATKVQDFIG